LASHDDDKRIGFLYMVLIFMRRRRGRRRWRRGRKERG